MKLAGIICEYNPFHRGHLRQLRLTREALGGDCAIVCLMSGNYVQRGEPAIYPKALRAQAAVQCGADLVLELPLTVALSSAEGFAAGGVRILNALGCQALSFGSEAGSPEPLLAAARANLDPCFDRLLRKYLTDGVSYASARASAMEELGVEIAADAPNDILGVEYCKAILRHNSSMEPLVIPRTGSYHTRTLDSAAPSAGALRLALARDESDAWQSAVPPSLHELYESAPLHRLEAGERAILARVRTLPEEAFRELPFGAEGLWSKLKKNCGSCGSVEEIIEETKSKRYARSRIQRMLLCAFLGLTAEDLAAPAPYARILAFNSRGRSLLRQLKPRFPLVNAGERPDDEAYYDLERRAGDLYSLFSTEGPRPGGEEAGQRVSYLPETETEPLEGK